MLIYSSISPYYLDYIASALTRQEILDDPDLCHLLENPYIKDNMEMALRFKESKRAGGENGSGGESYEAKKDFIEYFLANGPELDADTILYYREKCLLDDAYAQIAESIMVDIGDIDYIRQTFYKKEVDEENCSSLPCNYLEPMNAQVGMMGDSNNFCTLSNIFAKIIRVKEEEKKEEENKDNKEDGKDDKKEEDKKEDTSFLGQLTKAGSSILSAVSGQIGGGEQDASKTQVGEGNKDENGEEEVWGHIRQHVTQKIIPNVREAIQGFYQYMGDEMKDFAARCADTGIGQFLSLGDSYAIDRSEAISAATKSNVNQKLGDCARLWQQMRRYNAYDATMNSKGPIDDGKIVANKSTQGTSIDNTPPTTALKKMSPTNVSTAAAKGDKTAQAIDKLNNLKWCYTAEDIAKLKLPDSEFSREEKLALINKVMNEANTNRAAYRDAEKKIMEDAGIGDTGNDYARWSEARDNADAKNNELADEFMALSNAIKSQEDGSDENTPSQDKGDKDTSENDVTYSEYTNNGSSEETKSE